MLIVEHTFPVYCNCPVDGKEDDYTVTLRLCCESLNDIIKVEDLLQFASAFKGKTLFQEQVTAEFHRVFKCKVSTIGFHSGVKTVCSFSD